MDEAYLKRQLAINRDRVAALARGIPEQQARWKPMETSWSILEVICHLADEEEFDFPVRLKLIMEGSERPWPTIDPQGWVEEHEYLKSDLYEVLNRYVKLRNQSLEWLDSLETPDWAEVVQSPSGDMVAGDMLASWAAHDLLHLRQLVELNYAYLIKRASPFKVDYAGEW
jgi:hypothetical protein